MQVKRKVLLSVVTGALIAGLLSYALLANAGYFSTNSSTNQGLRVEGHGVIKVFNAQGKLVKQWEGYNSLNLGAINEILGCASGYPGKIGPLNTCSGFTNATEVYWTCNGSGCPTTSDILVSQTASQEVFCSPITAIGCGVLTTANDIPFSGSPPTSATCNPTIFPTSTTCSGWNVTSTISGAFTTQNCATSGCPITGAGAASYIPALGLGGFDISYQFDSLYPSITVTPGDTLVLTISFTVS